MAGVSGASARALEDFGYRCGDCVDSGIRARTSGRDRGGGRPRARGSDSDERVEVGEAESTPVPESGIQTVRDFEPSDGESIDGDFLGCSKFVGSVAGLCDLR